MESIRGRKKERKRVGTTKDPFLQPDRDSIGELRRGKRRRSVCLSVCLSVPFLFAPSFLLLLSRVQRIRFFVFLGKGKKMSRRFRLPKIIHFNLFVIGFRCVLTGMLLAGCFHHFFFAKFDCVEILFRFRSVWTYLYEQPAVTTVNGMACLCFELDHSECVQNSTKNETTCKLQAIEV